jgi:hypothetical protein
MKPWRLRLVERARRSLVARAQPMRMNTVMAGECWLCQSRVKLAPVLVLAASMCGACFPHEEQQLSCDDVYAPGDFDYAALEDLIMQTETRTTKGCLGAPCHSAETQRGGVRLDTRDLIYEELSARPELYYETLATGYMPHDGVRWDEEDLKIYRSWYCAGAFPP